MLAVHENLRIIAFIDEPFLISLFSITLMIRFGQIFIALLAVKRLWIHVGIQIHRKTPHLPTKKRQKLRKLAAYFYVLGCPASTR